MRERLQKLISAAGLASRRRAEELILAGRVSVNGKTAGLGERADPETDAVCVDGRPLRAPAVHTYILLNKPRGYVCTLRDERGRRTVAEAAHALMHPSHAVDKVYRAEVAGDVEAALPILRGPMELDGRPLAPAKVEHLEAGVLRVTIHEGRNRQVRRMCAAAGLRVLRLTRVAEGGLELDSLPPGRWRRLRPEELRALGCADPESQNPAKMP